VGVKAHAGVHGELRRVHWGLCFSVRLAHGVAQEVCERERTMFSALRMVNRMEVVRVCRVGNGKRWLQCGAGESDISSH